MDDFRVPFKRVEKHAFPDSESNLNSGSIKLFISRKDFQKLCSSNSLQN